jgi:hypothetical protein
MLFKVLNGSYTQDGKVYAKGQTVESKHRLDKMFKNKFERVQSEPEEYEAPAIPTLFSPPAGGNETNDSLVPPAFMKGK